jgi:Arc/MetJ-type ribon-helix-helix transcriptional regulator
MDIKRFRKIPAILKDESVSITIPKDLVAWIDENVRERSFANRSHGVVLCVKEEKERRPRLLEKWVDRCGKLKTEKTHTQEEAPINHFIDSDQHYFTGDAQNLIPDYLR